MITNKAVLALANLSLIVARSENGAIGLNQHIPWDLAEDRAYFKALTWGHSCILGRKTLQSLPNQTLPCRRLLVLSKNIHLVHKNIQYRKNITEIIHECALLHEEFFCIGGYRVYQALLPYTATIYLTKINGNYKGDVFFPEQWLQGFECVEKIKSKECSYLTLKRSA